MRGINRVFLMGCLGADPIVRSTKTGRLTCEVSIATNRIIKDEAGYTEAVDWHRVRFWEQKADLVGRFLTKGSAVAIEGQMRTDNWTDKDDVRHYRTYVVADQIHFLPSDRTKSQSSDKEHTVGEPPLESAYPEPEGIPF